MRATVCMLLVLTLLTACGSEPEPEPPMKVEDTAFGDMTQTLERAKSVEATTMEHKQELDRVLEETEGGSR